jgi:hypothetical protein
VGRRRSERNHKTAGAGIGARRFRGGPVLGPIIFPESFRPRLGLPLREPMLSSANGHISSFRGKTPRLSLSERSGHEPAGMIGGIGRKRPLRDMLGPESLPRKICALEAFHPREFPDRPACKSRSRRPTGDQSRRRVGGQDAGHGLAVFSKTDRWVRQVGAGVA